MQRNSKNGGGEAARRKQEKDIALPAKPRVCPWTTTHVNTEGFTRSWMWL